MGYEFDYTQTETFNRAKLGPWEAFGNEIYSAPIEDGFGRFKLGEVLTSQIADHIVALHNHSIDVHRRKREEEEREERKQASRRRPQSPSRAPELVWKYREEGK